MLLLLIKFPAAVYKSIIYTYIYVYIYIYICACCVMICCRVVLFQGQFISFCSSESITLFCVTQLLLPELSVPV